MKSRFDNNDQEILCALGDVVLNDSLLENSFDVVAEFYNVDRDLLEVEKSMYHNSIMDESNPRAKTAADVDKMFQDGQCDLLPVLYKAANILASIPATSCTAERSE
jgi:hypothetical protein